MPLSPSMAAFPQFYSNYTIFPSDFPEFQTQASAINGNVNNFSVIENRMCGHHDSFIKNHIPNNGAALDHVSSVLECDTMSSSWFPEFSDQLAGNLSDLAFPVIYGGGADGGFQSLNGGGYKPSHHLMGDFGEECCGFVDDIIKPASYPNYAAEKWGSYQGNQMAAVEEPNIKLGRYTEEERKERILRYLKKRNQRNFNKTIKYACRKTLADRRVRVRGRFARNNDLCEDEIAVKKTKNISRKQDLYGGDDSIQFQIKNDDDEDDWLQEAMASLVYLSHSSPEDMYRASIDEESLRKS